MFLQPEYFRSVHFEIVPFDELKHIEYTQVSDGVGTKLINGYFSFIGRDEKKYAFVDIKNVKRSVNCSRSTYNCSASFPINQIHYSTNTFAEHNFVVINRPYWRFFD